jgi:hypothetical protein
MNEAMLRARFVAVKFDRGRCVKCGYDKVVFLEVHHVIREAVLRRLLSRKGRPCPLDVLYDTRNAMVLCEDPAPDACHSGHTSAMRRIPRSALSAENWEFAREHGLEYVLEAEYPEAKAA